MLTDGDRREIASMLLVTEATASRNSKRLSNLIKILVEKDIITKTNAASLRSY